MARRSKVVRAAITEVPDHGGGRCPFCTHPKAKKDIQAILEVRRQGQPTHSIRTVFGLLKDAYPDLGGRSWTALRDHIHRCEGGWGGKL
jgi:hypothetical protein